MASKYGSALWWHIDWPEGAPQAANTIDYYGWLPVAGRLVGVQAMMRTLNTAGNYTLALTNVGTGNTMLNAATFNMNGLVATTITALTLTGTEADRRIAALGGWTLELVSDNGGFDGSGIYVSLYFEET